MCRDIGGRKEADVLAPARAERIRLRVSKDAGTPAPGEVQVGGADLAVSGLAGRQGGSL